MAYRLELEQQITQKLDISTSHIVANIKKYTSGKQSKQLAYGSDELSLKFVIWMNIHALVRYRPMHRGRICGGQRGFDDSQPTCCSDAVLQLLALRSALQCQASRQTRPEVIAKLAAVSHERWLEPRKAVVPAGVITDKPQYHSRFETAADGTRIDTANTAFADLPESLKKRLKEKATLAYKWKSAPCPSPPSATHW